MENSFRLDIRLSEGNVELATLHLCQIIFVDNALFPWLILVPRRPDIIELIDLQETDRITLIKEISLISEVMQEIFVPDKLNIAALGNIVPQLHVHVIARYQGDSAWPHPVFGKVSAPYELESRAKIISKLKDKINSRLMQ